MPNKKSTKELLGDYIDLEIQGETCEDEDITEIHNKLMEVKGAIRQKVDGIDYFMVELSRREARINAEIDAIRKEEKRLKVRRKATESLKDYFNTTLLPLVITELGDENGVYETNTARYKMFETWGPVIVYREDSIPDDFKIVKMVESIDKKKARDVLKSGADVPGLSIQRVKRVRRS